MDDGDATRRLDRHALVMTVWLSAGAVAAVLFHLGFSAGAGGWVLAGFGALLAGFAAHVVVNAVQGTEFSVRELAVGLVVTGGALLAFLFATLGDAVFAGLFLLPVAVGFAALLAAFVFHLLTRHGVRAAFDRFDVIRDFNPRKASRLPHRGGRR